MLMTALADKLTNKLSNTETTDTGGVEYGTHRRVCRMVCVSTVLFKGNTTQRLTS
jgi:hypothetical protein